MIRMTKYGRNKLPKDDKRQIKIEVFLSNNELKIVEKNLKDKCTGKNVRRALLNNSYELQTPSDDKKQYVDGPLVFELKKIGVNLNQIAYKINLNEFPVPGELDNLISDLTQLISERLPKK
jgi:hypothetical protein